MPILSKKKEIEQEVVLENIDPLTCQEKLKGSVDSEGRCRVRILYNPDEPDKVLLKKLELVEASRPKTRGEGSAPKVEG